MICITFLVSPKRVFAEEGQSKTTDLRAFSELCELYAYRAAAYKELFGDDYKPDVGFSFYYTRTIDDMVSTSCGAGTAIIYPDDFLVSELSMNLFIYYPLTGESKQNIENCILGMSALETSAAEDDAMSVSAKYVGGPKNAVIKAISIYNNEIVPKLTDKNLEMVKSGNEILLYSGNYNYYLEYMAADNNGDTKIEFMEIVAKERK